MDRKVTWVKIANSLEDIKWKNNNLTIIDAGIKKITLARKGKLLWACALSCPHAGALISEGFIDAADNIVCPLHSYKFSLTSGRNISGEGYKLKVFAVEEKADGIYVALEDMGTFI